MIAVLAFVIPACGTSHDLGDAGALRRRGDRWRRARGRGRSERTTGALTPVAQMTDGVFNGYVVAIVK